MEAAVGVEADINTISQSQEKQMLFSVSRRERFLYNHPSRLACCVSAGGQRGHFHRPAGQHLCLVLLSRFVSSPGSAPSLSWSHGAGAGVSLASGIFTVLLQPELTLTEES